MKWKYTTTEKIRMAGAMFVAPIAKSRIKSGRVKAAQMRARA
ncbi:hypothetical protein DHBDCA_p1302 [Dehalobacter sp. DCA]|nr:hypothetical protein DHBDCA_p1302 [Dehalobacter sp. DCA]AFV05374.1 hypothetical protein DCF50_p1368 [Dehalobacter sp. CF]